MMNTHSAGFRPLDDATLLADEPAVADLLRLLRDPRVPEATRGTIREVISLLVGQWKSALR